MIVKNQNDILSILKMYMDNVNISQSEVSRITGTNRPQITRTFSGKHAVNIDTLLKYIDACDAVLDINILPKPHKDKDKDTNKSNN